MEEYERLTSVNLKGALLGMKHAAPAMKRQRSGSIITTSSIGSLMAENAPHLYCAVKAAVNHLRRCVANELGGSGVRVDSLCRAPSSRRSSRAIRGCLRRRRSRL